MTILRDYKQTESSDFRINILVRLDSVVEAVSVFDSSGSVTGWKIQFRRERG